MNTDLYQALTVALLGAITVLLIVVIASLGRLRKALGTTRMTSPEATQPAVADRAETPAPATSEETPPAATSQTEARPAEGGQEAAREPAGARSVFTRPEETGEPAEAEPAAVGADSQQADTQQVALGANEPSAEQEEPQEQPFERDGRWWFRRGEELLVYDEQTGQWLQVAGPPGGLGGATSTGEASGGVATETRTVTETSTAGDQEESATSARSFWKCASCGAINGAAATSCRMCFAARP